VEHKPDVPGAEDAEIVFEHVDMAFGNRVVFRRFGCRVPRGKITVILGGSGSGKSTVLRLIGGLIRPLRGSIRIAGHEITHLSERQMYEVRQRIGMMFQGGALLDSMTVFDNLAFPLREHSHLSEAEIRREVHDRLASVGLSNVDDLLPGQLSGGMAKRVALCRAIMMRPVVLLCDEPLSGLDPISTRRIERLLMYINTRLEITVVAVSHDVASTLRMADHVLILLPDGAVEGTPEELRGSSDRRITSFLSEDVDPALIEGSQVEAEPLE
jgi:phospholipid/cholesterol/gamma-HCH transport system ATP-binding protein